MGRGGGIKAAARGRTSRPDARSRSSRQPHDGCRGVRVFVQAKKNDGLEPPTIAKLQKTCDRIQEFCETAGVFTLEGVSLIHLTNWPWDRYFNTTHSLRTNQERVKSFFRYFHNAGVIAKNPAAAWKRIKGKTEQSSGFTQKEYEKIIDTAERLGNRKLHALVQVIRFGGLAIIDAACLERSQIIHKDGEYRIRLASRQQTHSELQTNQGCVPSVLGHLIRK